MCGIVGGFTQDIQRGIDGLAHRGPDARGSIRVGQVTLGHTRLSILDLDARSNQPFVYQDVHLVFNGEIWNYKALRTELETAGYTFQTSGDTEVVAAALSAWGVDALVRLNGMFAIAWTLDGETLYLARDRFGEIPLHVAKQRPFLFASELKALKVLGAHPGSFADIEPGHYAVVTARNIRQVQYYLPPIQPVPTTLRDASVCLYSLLEQAVHERTIADVPVCTLLSGGIDSSVIAYFAKQLFPDLVAYTAVYNPKSLDLRAARQAADMIGIELREISVPLPSSDDLRSVIEHIEMPYKAQVEIGWPCLHLARAMQGDGFKVTFSGEGSDELWASYGFAYHALKSQDWHAYRRDLFLTQARKNFPRSNKIFMAHSIECRLPFLNPSVVEYALSLPQTAVQDGRSRPKAVIQNAFLGKLPDYITRRPKVAFQDGMGLKDAIAQQFADPKRFYQAEYTSLYG